MSFIRQNPKHRVVLHSSSEPSSNAVLDEFRMDVNTYLSANHLIIVAAVDGRGTGGRGSRVLYADYKRLGTGDVDDQIAVARWERRSIRSYFNISERFLIIIDPGDYPEIQKEKPRRGLVI